MAYRMPWARTRSAEQAGLELGFKSGLEEALAAQLKELGVPVRYEAMRVDYLVPARTARYSPDFLLPNGLVIESKGRFTADDRAKHRLVKAEHPGLELRFVFSRSKQTISKTSSTSYADWCVRYGFVFADRLIPLEWIKEPVDRARLKAAERWLKTQ